MPDALISENINWSAERTNQDPAYFRRRVERQAHILWIGCSDNPHVDLETGSVADQGCLHYRNPGNQASVHDLALAATLHHALNCVGVRELVVCGHYGCDCLKEVLHGPGRTVASVWTGPIRAIAEDNAAALKDIVTVDAQIQTLCELNVRGQVRSLSNHPLVAPLIRSSGVHVRGIVWSPRDGLFREIEKHGRKTRTVRAPGTRRS